MTGGTTHPGSSVGGSFGVCVRVEVTANTLLIDFLRSSFCKIEYLGLVAARFHMRPAWPVAAFAGCSFIAMHQRKLGVRISRKLCREIAVAQRTGIVPDKVGGMYCLSIRRGADVRLIASGSLRTHRLRERKQDCKARDSIEPTSHLAHRWNILHYAGVRFDNRRTRAVRLSRIAHNRADRF